jgi:Fe-S-cluster-containing hydrogenase component 2
MTLLIDYDKCCWKDGKCTSCTCGGECSGCLDACPVGAITRTDKVIIDQEACIGCGACITACEHDALQLQ